MSEAPTILIRDKAMRPKEEIKAELYLLSTQRAEIQSKFEALKQELAECVAEFKVGQRVINRGEEFEISTVRLAWRETVQYTARKVLKSGALHKNATGLYTGNITAKAQS